MVHKHSNNDEPDKMNESQDETIPDILPLDASLEMPYAGVMEEINEEELKKKNMIIHFIKEHIIAGLLFLGIAFLFTSALLFLRSNWGIYKVHVFFGFVILTTLCFVSGYISVFLKKKIPVISVTLLSLASIFFPMNFYFALKAGLIQSSGNTYRLLWITTGLFIFHSLLLKSTLVLTLGSFVFTWAHTATLKKFLPGAYASHALSYALQGYLFFLIALYYEKNKDRLKAYILLIATNILLVFSLFQVCVFWKLPSVIMVLMVVMVVMFSQIQHFGKVFFGKFAINIFSFALLAFWILFLHLFGISLSIASAISMLSAFLLAFMGEYWDDESIGVAIYRRSTLFPFILLGIATILGNFEHTHGKSSLLILGIFSTMFYVLWGYRKHSGRKFTYASLFSLLSIYALLELTVAISSLHYPFFLLLWGILLTGIAYFPKWKSQTWATEPVLQISKFALPVALVFFLWFGRLYYVENFSLLSAGLILSALYYFFIGYEIQNTPMMVSGATIFSINLAMFAWKLEAKWHYFALFMVFLGIILAVIVHKILEPKKVTGSSALSRLSLVLVLAFTAMSFYSGVGKSLWEVDFTILLGLIYFFYQLHRFSDVNSFRGVVVYFNMLYYLLFFQSVSLYTLPIVWFPLVFLALYLVARIEKGEKVTSFLKEHKRVYFEYVKVVTFAGVCFLAIFFKIYYFYLTWTAIALSLLLLIATYGLAYHNEKNKIYTYGSVILLALNYFLLLPQNIFPFQYGLFLIPFACILLSFGWYTIENAWKKPTFILSQIIVNGIIALPFLFPGVVPGALVSFFIMLFVFGFYSLCFYFYRHIFYVCMSVIFFLLTVCIGLFASKVFWGREITLIMSFANVAVFTFAFFLKRMRQYSYFIAVIYIMLAHLTLLVISLLVQGKVDVPTIFTMISCSIQLGILSNVRLEDYISWISSKTLGFFSMIILVIAYFMFLLRMDFPYPDRVLQYLSPAILSLGLALIFRKYKNFSNPLFAIAFVTPFLAFIRIVDLDILTLVLSLTFLIYFCMSLVLELRFLAKAAWICFFLIPYSLFMNGGVESFHFFGFYAVLGGIIFTSVALLLEKKFPSRLYLWESLKNLAFIHQFALFVYIFLDGRDVIQTQLYTTVFLCILNTLYLVSLFRKERQHIISAVCFFFFSYYMIVHSWSMNLWELYMAPIGLLVLAYGAYVECKDDKIPVHNIYLTGLIFILLPTFLQSYKGWFEHLRFEGDGMQNLYHSIFLSLESIGLILFGIYRKRLVFFFTGVAFLIADILLMIFSYVNFGNIPQAIWWATLGISLILGAWLLEYNKNKMQALKESIIEKQKRLVHELKGWN